MTALSNTALPGDEDTTCESIMTVGEEGGLTPFMCEQLSSIVKSRCGCSAPTIEEFEPSCQLCPTKGEVILAEEESPCYSFVQVMVVDDIPESMCASLKNYASVLKCVCGVPGSSVRESALTDVPTQAPTSAPTDAPTMSPTLAPVLEAPDAFICPICGDGKVVTAPASELIVGAPSTQCGLLQDQGDNGDIPPAVCSNLQRRANGLCGCQDQNFNEDQVVTFPICDVCDGLTMTKPDALFIPDVEATRCQVYQERGRSGKLPPRACEDIHEYKSRCGCEEVEVEEEDEAESLANTVCDICDGLTMTTPENSLIPGARSTNCGSLQERGAQGLITVAACKDMQTHNIHCGCEASFTEAEASEAPMATPSFFPTFAATVDPTAAPTAGCKPLFGDCDSVSTCCGSQTVCDNGICIIARKPGKDERGDSKAKGKLYEEDDMRAGLTRRRHRVLRGQ